MLQMNRETSIRSSSDTLVIVDDGARRKRIAIIAGAVVAVLVLLIALMMFGHHGNQSGNTAAANAGQIPTVSVIVPGQSQVGRVVTASGPLAAKRDQPIGIAGAGGRVTSVAVDAGTWVRAGQVLATVDTSVQAQQSAQLAAQIAAATGAITQKTM